MQTDKLAEKKKRLDTAISLNEPDRVPLAPKGGMFYGTAYGVSYYDVMMDNRNAIPGMLSYMEEYDPDMVWAPIVYPIPPMEAVAPNYIKWPGPQHGLPLTSPYQVLDNSYINDDEFGEFVKDPTHFILTKLIPRKHENLKGFSKLYLRDAVDLTMYIDFSIFTDPDVIAAFACALECAKKAKEWMKTADEIADLITEKGFVTSPRGVQSCPYDMFSDNYRGLIKTAMDVIERPDELEAAVDVCREIVIESTLKMCKDGGPDYVLIPLHGGVDEFMSPDNFDRFYWKGLKELLETIIDCGSIPYVFCEGKYDSRLHRLAEIPKGKVVYMFESVDMKQVKKILGPTTCICGNISSSLLAYGKPQEVADECKRLLDICAPGGGFIMDVSVDLTNADPKNVEAMFETTRNYGKYK